MSNREQIDKAFEILRDCFKRGGKLLLCGNGGSAADCDHIVAELVNGMKHIERAPGLPAISLCAHTGAITAIINDRGAEWIFAQQVLAYRRANDVLWAISTSGKSKNILKALDVAKLLEIKTIGLTGEHINEFSKYCDVVISCLGSNAAQIQEQHIKVYHELCARLEEEFFG